MPFQIARFRVDADAAGGVKVVAGAVVGLPRVAQPGVPGRRVAGAEHQRVGVGVVGAAKPGRAAAGFPEVARPGRVQRAGHGRFVTVQRAHVAFDHRTGPNEVAGFRVAGLNLADDAEFAAGVAGDDQAVHDQRGRRVGITGLVVGDLLTPDDVACLGVQRDDARIKRAEVDLVAIERRAAVDDVAAGQDALGQAGVILPKLFAGLHVDGVETAVGAGDVHHAVINQRLGFLTALLFTTERESPGGNEILDVVLVQRLQRAVTLQVAPHAVGDDLTGHGLVVRQHLFGHARRMARRVGGPRRHDAGDCGHDQFSHLVLPVRAAFARAH